MFVLTMFINYNGRFILAKYRPCVQTRKPVYSLSKVTKTISSNILPILSYCCTNFAI